MHASPSFVDKNTKTVDDLQSSFASLPVTGSLAIIDLIHPFSHINLRPNFLLLFSP
jgi:hypothetical protein